MTPSDDTLWHEVRERAARRGWDDQQRICAEAASHVCRRLKITEDAGREAVRGRIDRLWTMRMADWLGAG